MLRGSDFAQHTFNILPVWRNKRATDILPPNNFVINSSKQFSHQQDERSSYFSLLNIVDAEQKGTLTAYIEPVPFCSDPKISTFDKVIYPSSLILHSPHPTSSIIRQIYQTVIHLKKTSVDRAPMIILVDIHITASLLPPPHVFVTKLKFSVVVCISTI